ncbi:pilin [Micromonospora tulbaghiae]|uniref:pilin n=1 Tax=Micromonospora tulbaghiae TaxID=479978 RepID=UPI0033E3F17F
MNQHPILRPEAAHRRLGADRCGRRTAGGPRRHRLGTVRAALVLLNAVAVTAVTVAVPHVAYAVEPAPVVLAAESIQQVANNIRAWLTGILVAVATLFLTVGALRYMVANGDTGEIEKAKLALRSAAIGYALALLAPLFVTIVRTWVA